MTNGGKFVAPREIIDQMSLETSERFLDLVERVFRQRHDFLVVEAARRLRASLPAAASSASESAASEWIPIESLSSLRTHVGGRFQNLRDRWVASGFPLREHRGDKDGVCVFNESGWIELSTWISKQGFEARLTPERKGCLFELRAVKPPVG